MKTKFRGNTFFVTAVLGLGLVFCACSDDKDSNASSDLNGTNIFSSLDDAIREQLPIFGVKSIVGLGNYPSSLAIDGKYGYVVDYSNNSIHRVELETYTVDASFIDLGQNAGPYGVYADDASIYVANQGIAEILKFDKEGKNKQTVLTQESIKAPTDVLTFRGNIVVADSEYDYANPEKTEGKIVVVTAKNEVVERKTTTQNPAFVRIIGTGDDAFIVSLNAGVITYNEDFIQQTLPEKSCLNVWKFSDFIEVSKEPSVRTFCVPHTSLGAMAWNEDILVMGNATQAKFHTISMKDLRSTESSDAIIESHTLAAIDEPATIVPVVIGKSVALFNSATDSVLWDALGEAIEFGLSKIDVKKMPIDVELDSSSNRIFVLNSASGSLDVIDVKK